MVTVTGKPVIFVGGGVVPAFFGQTTMTLLPDRVHSTTRRLLNKDDATLVLGHVEAISITSRVNWLWFILAMLTMAFFGLGLVFLVLFLVLRERFLTIYGSGALCVGLRMQGDESPYIMFRDSILASVS